MSEYELFDFKELKQAEGLIYDEINNIKQNVIKQDINEEELEE